ncbi:MAG: SIS domain-containing protein [Lachnospiraceae bacterium]|nr:SIS domain-containing protein [Lachnospiraceae bacterium]
MIAYFEDVLKTITDSMESIDEATYENLVNQCTETIQNGGKIIASGLGKNVPICEKFVGTLNSFGIDARFLHTNTAIHGDLGMVTEKDLVIVLSKGGNTVETVDLIQHLLDRETNTWLFSFAKNGKSAELLPDDKILMLELDNEGDEWDIVPNNSTTVNLIVLQGIAIEMAKRMNVTLEDFKKNHPGGGIGARLRGEQIWK